MRTGRVIDVDGHITEPADLWEQYLEPKFRPRAIRIASNRAGLETLLIDGRPHHVFAPGTLGMMAGYGLDPIKLLEPGVYTYRDGCPSGGYDPSARLKVMDEEGIDVAVLYPTIGLTWEGHVSDPALAAAYCRAYNTWLVEYCQADPQRLVPVAHISLSDLAAARIELRRAVQAGARGVFVRSDLIGDRPLGHRSFDPFWADCQDLDVPVGLHVVVRDDRPLAQWWRGQQPELGVGRSGYLFHFAFLTLPVVAAFTSLLQGGTLERFPRLKVAILETGVGWLPHWLERLDAKYRLVRDLTPLSRPPSDYFRRQCWVSAEPDEETIPYMTGLLGDDRVVWASDYPHVDAHLSPVKALRHHMAELPSASQQNILGDNAVRLYGL
jgi:uncharacterized protein